ncbi:hypothetical protein ABZ801_38895 [Actinomadura sp. NPDC047616]|uniref:hypothetical protein n=1 Tax=Actinomadura sp. NPDC047616 TaxID=3155914 RepID=UPI0033C355DD
MGFWGYLVVGRDDRPLPELYTMRPYHSGIAGNRARADNWQVCSLGSGVAVPDTVRLLVDLSAETRAPALMASVVNDDCVSVEGFSSDGYWQACPPRRGRDGAAAGRWELREEACAREAAARAAGWAVAAGRSVTAEPIAALLITCGDRRVDGFFEEFLVRLGLGPCPN